MQRPSRRATLPSVALLVAALAASTRDARADGGIPRAHQILFEPGNPSDIVLRSDFWGLFQSKDGGQSWQYGCAELFGGNSKQGVRRSTILLPGGRILVGVFEGIRMTDDFCNWRDNASMAGHFVEDITQVSGSPSPAELLAISADGVDAGVITRLWHSTDNGDTWSHTGGTLPANYVGSSLRVAPSDPQRVYVGGTSVGDVNAALARSDDGGATWTVKPFGPPGNPNFETRIGAIHPTKPDVVFVWVDLTPDPGATLGDEIWATGDGGVTWKRVYVGKDDLPGLALSPDGSHVLVSGKEDSIQAAAVDDALANGQSAFRQVFDGHVWGLNWTADGLYAGNDNFTRAGIPAFSLGHAKDTNAVTGTTGSLSFDPMMSVCELKFATCAADSEMEATCRTPWDGVGGYNTDYLHSSRCIGEPDAGADGGTTTSSSHSKSSGCATAVAGRTSNDLTWVSVGAVVAVLGGLARGRRAARR